MTTPTIFETCKPRDDVLSGAIADADFAADLASVIAATASREYREPARFFADTYPTRGLKDLLANVCGRLSGTGDEVGPICRLDTAYGGSKTHGLIALAHLAKGLAKVPNIAEFVNEDRLPERPVRFAAFDGENADPANGRAMGGGVLAYTPWGEIAHALAGPDGYERVRRSDESRIAPGAETLRELFGGEPSLILLDELAVYLRKVQRLDDARGQLTAFLTSLMKAVEEAPQAALVHTLAIGKDGLATDAYSEENRYLADQMAEAESVSARKATILNPTEEDKTVHVLRRRLFKDIDEAGMAAAVDAFRDYEDTVETDVYRALRERINLFETVVGRLQPILARLPGTITETVLAGREDRDASRAIALENVENHAREITAGAGFDLDEVLADDLTMPERATPRVTLDALDRVIGSSDLMPPGMQVRPLGPREYGLLTPGMDTEVRVTTSPDFYEEHAENVELWSPGSPLFHHPEHIGTAFDPKCDTTLDELLDR